MTLKWVIDKDVGQRKYSTLPLTLSGRKKKDHDLWEGQGSLSAAQPELSASSGGTDGSLHPLLLGLLNSATAIHCKMTTVWLHCGDGLSSDKLCFLEAIFILTCYVASGTCWRKEHEPQLIVIFSISLIVVAASLVSTKDANIVPLFISVPTMKLFIDI